MGRVYLNQPIVDPEKVRGYGDTPRPRVFGNVSPLDPQLFSRINDFADALIEGKRDGKYSPIEVAVWLEDLAAAAEKHLAEMEVRSSGKDSVEYRRLTIDLALQTGLGRFFAAKFRSGVLYRIHEQSGDRAALEEALKAYRAARGVWAKLAERAKGIYMADITVGERAVLRGHWLDRLPAIDEDIADIAAKLDAAKTSAGRSERVRRAVEEALGRPQRRQLACRHTPPASFRPVEPLTIERSVDAGAQPKPTSVILYYRHVN